MPVRLTRKGYATDPLEPLITFHSDVVGSKIPKRAAAPPRPRGLVHVGCVKSVRPANPRSSCMRSNLRTPRAAGCPNTTPSPEFANPTRCTLTHRMSRSRRFHWAAAEELLLRMFSILGAGCEADAWPVPCYEHCLTNDTTRETDPSAARRSRDPSALSHTALARGRCDEGGRRLQ